jgi:hypothetical protein
MFRALCAGHDGERVMRGFAAYLTAGAVVVLAMGVFSPPVGLSFAVGWPAVEKTAPVEQTVDRTHKGDRFDVPQSIIGRQPAVPAKSPEGCELAYSPLSRSANGIVSQSHRCIA